MPQNGGHYRPRRGGRMCGDRCRDSLSDLGDLHGVDQQNAKVGECGVIGVCRGADGGPHAWFHHRTGHRLYRLMDACGYTGVVPPSVHVIRP